MSAFVMHTSPQNLVSSAAAGQFRIAGKRRHESTISCSQVERSHVNSLSLTGKASAKATLRSVTCCATQTQSAQRKSSAATIQRSDPKGKLKGPKLDDGSGGFPPFRFGKGSEVAVVVAEAVTVLAPFPFLRSFCVRFGKGSEKNLLLRNHRVRDEASIGLAAW